MVSRTKLNITVFTSGFVLMVFEIVGSRILAPFLGSSSVVWTSIIGVILAFMSLGYWQGGKMADKYHSLKTLATALVLAAIAMLVMNLGKNVILKFISQLDTSLIVKSVLSSALLFSVPSFLLAFVTPFAIRLEIHGVEDSGQTSGSIYAISTVGSITGTFVSGFVFITLLGTNQIIWMLAAILFILVAYISPPVIKSNAIWSLILLAGNVYNTARARSYVDIDTEYARVFIEDRKFNDHNTRFMFLSGYVNSGMYIDNPNELIFEYTEFYDLVDFYAPSWDNAVIFGGGGYSYPKHFQEKYPDKKLDVVELDPKVTELAETYFDFKATENTKIIHRDARYFMSSTHNKYDVVFYDVLTSPLTVPFHLTTLETFQQVSELISDNGVLILNTIGDLNGHGSRFVRSEFKTIKEVFPQVFLFSTPREKHTGLKNFIMVALKSENKVPLPDSGYFFDTFLQYSIDPGNLDDAIVLTDNYAPANYLISSQQDILSYIFE